MRHVFIRHDQSSGDFNDDTALRLFLYPPPPLPFPPTKLTLRHVLATQGENSLRNYRSIGARSDLTRGVESIVTDVLVGHAIPNRSFVMYQSR